MKNTIVKNENYCTISYYFDEPNSPLKPTQLTGGVPTTLNGEKGVRFSEKLKGKPVMLRFDSRPVLAALVEEYNITKEEIEAENDLIYALEKAKKEAADKPFLDAMYAQAEELKSQLPVNHVLVTVIADGTFDGERQWKYEYNGEKLHNLDVTTIGIARATRSAGSDSFAEIPVVSIDLDKLAEIKAEREAKESAEIKAKADEIARIETAFKKARETGKLVELRSWHDDCNDPHEDCDVDLITEYATPNGKTTTKRSHTW